MKAIKAKELEKKFDAGKDISKYLDISKGRNRALMALEEMQKRSLELGLNKITNAEIESEIKAVRKSRRK